MTLQGNIGAYGLGCNHFYLSLHPLSQKENNLTATVLKCEYQDSLLEELKSLDHINFRLQHVLGQPIEVEGEVINGRKLTVTRANLL